MRLSPLPRACAAAVLVAGLAACDGGTAPQDPLAPTYVLVRVDGKEAPLIIANHVRADGIRQLYTMRYDTLAFVAGGRVNRHLRADMDTFDPFGALIPVVTTRYQYSGRVVRKRDRIVAEYEGPGGAAVAPDTFSLRDGSLVKMGPFGVPCAGCAPVRRVEYVYEPR